MNLHCWFLSAILAFWLLFAPVYRGVRRASLTAALLALAALCAIPWAALPALADWHVVGPGQDIARHVI